MMTRSNWLPTSRLTRFFFWLLVIPIVVFTAALVLGYAYLVFALRPFTER
jgi:hypothetical protein